MKRMVLQGGLAVLAIAALLWAGDYVTLKLSHSRFATVTVRRYYAVKKKANRVEYIFDSARDQPCVNSLFPHLGAPACWYVRRHAEERITI
jgi:hypothetical protein